jgi:hypothetical protein
LTWARAVVLNMNIKAMNRSMNRNTNIGMDIDMDMDIDDYQIDIVGWLYAKFVFINKYAS